MRRLIYGMVAAAAMVVGVSSAGFAAPGLGPHEYGDMNPQVANIHRADYYWNHHHYAHRDWDRHHHRWHYY